VNRRLALALVLLLIAVALATALLLREGSVAGSEGPADDGAACAEASNSEAFSSDAFNFGDAVACGQSARRSGDAGPHEPPK
jgi:hypothetical protein